LKRISSQSTQYLQIFLQNRTGIRAVPQPGRIAFLIEPGCAGVNDYLSDWRVIQHSNPGLAFTSGDRRISRRTTCVELYTYYFEHEAASPTDVHQTRTAVHSG